VYPRCCAARERSVFKVVSAALLVPRSHAAVAAVSEREGENHSGHNSSCLTVTAAQKAGQLPERPQRPRGLGRRLRRATAIRLPASLDFAGDRGACPRRAQAERVP
jgi:hypothetical protein